MVNGQHAVHSDEVLSHHSSKRREFERCAVLSNQLVLHHLSKRVVSFADHGCTDSGDILLVSAGNNRVCRKLFGCLFDFVNRSDLLHSAFQELNCDLFLGEFGFAGVGCSWFC